MILWKIAAVFFIQNTSIDVRNNKFGIWEDGIPVPETSFPEGHRSKINIQLMGINVS
jgi:hypothetical protein